MRIIMTDRTDGSTSLESPQNTFAVQYFRLEEIMELDDGKKAEAARRLSAHSPAALALIALELNRQDDLVKRFPHYVMSNLLHLGVTEDMFPIEMPT